jgi:hypothetical protein
MADVLDDTAEAAIRNYLLFLEDPAKLIDHELIDQLQRKAQAATDPIDRLLAYAELERAQTSDDGTYRLDFILHAKGWATANKVGPTAFRRLGVKDDVLRSAGLLTDDARLGRKTRTAEPPPARSSVSVETIKNHVRSLRGRFTLADIQSSVGGSPMTVRKGVQELIAAGAITRLGPMPDWRGRGRAPIVFEAS